MYVKEKEKMTKDTVILLMVLFYPAVSNYFWRVLVGITGLFGVIITNALFDATVWTIVVGVAFLTSKERTISAKTLIISLSIVSLSLLSFVLTDYEYFTSKVLFAMLFGTFSFFIQGSIVDIKKVSQRHLHIVAIIVLCISITYSLYSISFKEISFEDNMDFAYKVLPSVLVIISSAFSKENNKFAIVFSVIGVLFLILQGTRGPVLCLVVFICLMLYKKYGFSKTFIRIGLIILLAMALLSSAFVKTLILDFTEHIDKSGYSSRVVTMMIQGELSDDNGRDAVKKILLDDIKENPLRIRGMFADREATRGLVDSVYGLNYQNGTYAHSLWLEMIYDWGVLFGGIILIFLMYSVIRIFKKFEKDDVYILLLFVSTGLVFLLLSSSYLQCRNFFFLMGLVLSYKKHIS